MNDSAARPRAGRSALKRTLAARRARDEQLALLRSDPIAIIGVGCRFPGGIDGPDAYWRLLAAGQHAITEVPQQRWDVASRYDPDPAVPGKIVAKHAGLVADVDAFDARYFGILPREAEWMDPQQRMFLEVAIDALDHAGQGAETLAGSRTGVYVASYYNDYATLAYRNRDAIDSRTLTGTLHSVLANRLSHFLDLRGPSLSLDTACSSSLVAIHLACQALRFGECDQAIAGGVSLMLDDAMMVALSKVGFLAPDGRCKTFDAAADGFGRGEGCGVIVLKRLSDAIADRDRVLALIPGSAVNQDGRSTVLAAPNGLAQQAVVEEALRNAQVDGSRVGFVETHGTGTALGDPIEVEALAATVGRATPEAMPCYLGSVKASIGHLEAAAGVAAVIKAVLALVHESIPPQPNFTRLNPHISLDGTRLAVPVSLVPWPARRADRIAGVSGFGVGGTNAHVLLEEAPALPADAETRAPAACHLLPMSARSGRALAEVMDRWIAFLGQPGASAATICALAGSRRTHHDHRLAVAGANTDALAAALLAARALAADPASAPQRRGRGAPRVAFVFSGQGQQWVGMGCDLLASEPVFRAALLEIDAAFTRIAPWSICAELSADAAHSRLARTDVAQPVIVAMQLALVRLWASWGIVPDAVVGHSVGEVAALHIAGVLALDEALRIVWLRGRAMQEASGHGRMVSVDQPEALVRERIRRHGDGVSIAAINAPAGTVLSGATATMEAIVADLVTDAVPHAVLPVDYAFHSRQMDPLAERLTRELGRIEARAPSLPVYSTVLGRALTADAAIEAGYLGRNIREPVRFAAAVAALLDDGFDTFVEIAAHPVLGASLTACGADRDPAPGVFHSMRRNRPARPLLMQQLGALYAAGATLDWDRINEATGEWVDLPAYPWQRERYWIATDGAIEADGRHSATALNGTPAGHELLGHRLPVADAAVFGVAWPTGAPAWLADHRIHDEIWMPATAMLESLRAAAAILQGHGELSVTDLVIRRSLPLPEGPGSEAEWQVSARWLADGRIDATLMRAIPGADGARQWERIAAATVVAVAAPSPGRAPSGSPGHAPGGPGLAPSDRPLSMPADTAAPLAEVYRRFASLGVAFGPAFQVIRAVEARDDGGFAWLAPSPETGPSPATGPSPETRPSPATEPSPETEPSPATPYPSMAIHPALLDGALQACSVLVDGAADGPRHLWLPVAVERYRVVGPVPSRLLCRVRVATATTGDGRTASVGLFAPDGAPVATLEGVRLARSDPRSAARNRRADPWCHRIDWQAVAHDRAEPQRPPRPAAWVVLCDPFGAGDALADRLEAGGQVCLRLQGSARDPAAFESAASAARRGGLPLAGVVDCSGLGRLGSATGIGDAGVALSAAHAARWLASGANGTASGASGAASGASGAASLILVSRGTRTIAGPAAEPQAASLWGLHDVIVAEYPELCCRIVDLDPELEAAEAMRPVADWLIREPIAGGASRRLAFRGDRCFVPRIVAVGARGADDHRELQPGAGGTLDALHWAGCAAASPGPGQARIRVRAAGLNFRDVLVALGMYPGSPVRLGAEVAGVVEAVAADVVGLEPGDRVFGLASGSLATTALVRADEVLRMADGEAGFEQVAGQPVAFLTALYGLERVARLARGQRVLIHAAAGGVGQAAVQIALRAGAEVFATAGSPRKRDWLRSIGVQHVLDSRSLDFADQILDATAGAGVDVVLNSLAGDFIGASVRVLSRGGWFLEIGKRDVWSVERFAAARPEAGYCVYDLARTVAAEPGLAAQLLARLAAGFRDGSLRPLPVRVYDFDDAEPAFRYMAQARHMGKLVLRNPDAGSDDHRSASFRFRADAAYLVSGAFGGVGHECARWLARRGAGALVLVGRHAPGAEAAATFDALRASGVRCEVVVGDVADEPAMRRLLDRLELPLAGVFHAAAALEDGILENQDAARFERAFRGKAGGAAVLDRLTRERPLEHFVVFGAAAVWLGSPGQGPYCAANADAEAVVSARRAVGLPGLHVAWGQWSGAGMAARLASQGTSRWSDRGLGWISPAEGFDRLERLLRGPGGSQIVLPIDWAAFVAGLPAEADRSLFPSVGPAPAASAGRAAAADGPVSTWRSLPPGQRPGSVLAYVTEQVLKTIGLGGDTPVDRGTPLKEIGLDSLMAVELRNALTRGVGQSLPATLVFDYPTLDAITGYLIKVLGLARQAGPATAVAFRAGAAAAGAVAAGTAAAETAAAGTVAAGTVAAGAAAGVATLSEADALRELIHELGEAWSNTRDASDRNDAGPVGRQTGLGRDPRPEGTDCVP